MSLSLTLARNLRLVLTKLLPVEHTVFLAVDGIGKAMALPGKGEKKLCLFLPVLRSYFQIQWELFDVFLVVVSVTALTPRIE